MTKRTKALSITPAVRRAVYERDSYDGCPCCIICGNPHEITVAHYISRSQSGLGIEENLVTMCVAHHAKFDHGYPDERREFRQRVKEYLRSKYDYWNEEMLKYRR